MELSKVYQKYYNCINIKATPDEWYKNNKIIFS